MIINFSPVRMEERLKVFVDGDKIVVNGELFDFTPLGEGDVLPTSAITSDWFFGEVTRTGGVICLTLILPHGKDAPESTKFPHPVRISYGEVGIPEYGG